MNKIIRLSLLFLGLFIFSSCSNDDPSKRGFLCIDLGSSFVSELFAASGSSSRAESTVTSTDYSNKYNVILKVSNGAAELNSQSQEISVSSSSVKFVVAGLEYDQAITVELSVKTLAGGTLYYGKSSSVFTEDTPFVNVNVSALEKLTLIHYLKYVGTELSKEEIETKNLASKLANYKVCTDSSMLYEWDGTSDVREVYALELVDSNVNIKTGRFTVSARYGAGENNYITPETSETARNSYLYMLKEGKEVALIAKTNTNNDSKNLTFKWYKNGEYIGTGEAVESEDPDVFVTEFRYNPLENAYLGSLLCIACDEEGTPVGSQGLEISIEEYVQGNIYYNYYIASASGMSNERGWGYDDYNLSSSSSKWLTAFAYDDLYNLYVARTDYYNTNAFTIDKFDIKYQYSKFSYDLYNETSNPPKTILSVDELKDHLDVKQVPVRMCTDGNKVFYITGASDSRYKYNRSDNKVYYADVNVDEAGTDAKYFEVPVFDYVTALTCFNGKLYVAGQKSGEVDEETGKQNDTYKIITYNIDDIVFGASVTLPEPAVYLSYDDDYLYENYTKMKSVAEGLIAEGPESVDLQTTSPVVDMFAFNNKVYGLQNNFFVNQYDNGSYEWDIIADSYIIYANDGSVDPVVYYSFPTKEEDENNYVLPARLIALRPKEWAFADGAKYNSTLDGKTLVGYVDLSTETPSLARRNYDYGYNFDDNDLTAGSGFTSNFTGAHEYKQLNRE